MAYRCFRNLQKFSLGGLVLLLLYLTWSPEQRQILIEKSNIGVESFRASTQPVTVNTEVFLTREQVVSKHCEGANLTAIKSPRTVIYSRKLRLAYCPLYSAASTATKYAMTITEGKQIYSHKLYNISLIQAIHSDTQKLALRSSAERVNGQADILLIVRDPWQRLVSGYRKLIARGKTSFARNCQSTLGVKEFINFDLFLRCIIKTEKEGKALNVHIQPTYQLCALCKIQYTRIVRFENLEAEMNTLFTPNNKKRPYGAFLNAMRNCPIERSPKYNLLPYLKDASDFSKRFIQHIYQEDFLLFGYPFL